ncbi:hypothetical protein P9112_008357 [Eukaryota sp. TZLM1-RC]
MRYLLPSLPLVELLNLNLHLPRQLSPFFNGSRDRDDRRRDRPKRPYLEASDLRDADKLLKFVNKFILWSRTDRVLRETRGNMEDPAQIALANEVARLREELELAREGSQPSIDEYFGNITGEPVHE